MTFQLGSTACFIEPETGSLRRGAAGRVRRRAPQTRHASSPPTSLRLLIPRSGKPCRPHSSPFDSPFLLSCTLLAQAVRVPVPDPSLTAYVALGK